MMEHGGDGARRATGRAGDGGTAGDGDAMRYGSAAVDGPHTGAHSFYSHRIGGPMGRGGRRGERMSRGRDQNVMWTRCVQMCL